ncbi:MAG: exodeoxyribonuclease VII small subunit [Lewinella sp.]
MSYAEALTELETILQELQQTPAEIDRLHARVARAEQLIASCRATLRSVEDELGKLGQTTDTTIDKKGS